MIKGPLYLWYCIGAANEHAITVGYLNKYEVTQSIVAEFKKLEGARYQKEMGEWPQVKN